MLPLLAIPIVNEASQIVSTSSTYFDQRIDVILWDVFVWTAWIPIVITLFWGFIAMWKNTKQGGYVSRLTYVLLAIDVPSMTEQSPKALENLFATLYGAKSSITWKEEWIYGKLHPVFSFEIISTEGYIQFLIRTQPRFRDVVEAGIYAHYPDAEIFEVEDYVTQFPTEFPDEEYEMWGGELTLDKHYMYPIRTYVDFEDKMTQEIKDPLGYMLEQMAKMKPGEHFWFQMLVQPSTNSWADHGMKHVRAIYGDEDKPKKSSFLAALEHLISWPSEWMNEALGIDLSPLLFGEDGPGTEEDQWKVFKITLPQQDEAKAVLQKTTKVGHGVKIRILYTAKKNAFVKVERTAIIKGMLNQYTHMNLNRFSFYIPTVPKDDYWWMRLAYTSKQKKLMGAYKSRSYGVGATPIFLNAEELATLWHFPTITMKAPLISKSESKRAEPPVGLPITYLENILPGYGEGEQDLPGASTDGEAPAVVSSLPTDVSDQPLPSTIPQPVSPTGRDYHQVPDAAIDKVETVSEIVTNHESAPVATPQAPVQSAVIPPRPTIIDPENLGDLIKHYEALESPVSVPSPTDEPVDDKESPSQDEDGFVPPNLPV
jgi:hypothetical protein